jgi:hypothetical protein
MAVTLYADQTSVTTAIYGPGFTMIWIAVTLLGLSGLGALGLIVSGPPTPSSSKFFGV